MFKEHGCCPKDCYTEYVIYQPESLRDVATILDEIAALNQESKALEDGLAL